MKVVELFAGVGGFRRGLEPSGHEVVWWNQWEPRTSRVQYAFDCYRANFHADEEVDPIHNTDITRLSANWLPNHDLLVGGFPCQDYSVMTSLKRAKGIRGKKGVLWWEIRRILSVKRPNYVLLENVGRLLHSPKKKPGRDFAIMLSCLAGLGYVVEWRTITADQYGYPQRRKRVFIFAARRNSHVGKWMEKNSQSTRFLTRTGFFAPSFPVHDKETSEFADEPLHLDRRLDYITRYYSDGAFLDSGIMVGRKVRQLDLQANSTEADVRLYSVVSMMDAPPKYFLTPAEFEAWKKAKQTRKVHRRTKKNYSYTFAEGPLPCPDRLDRSARTILTNEGSRVPNRTTHVVMDPKQHLPRLLTPEECELLMGFPTGWTSAYPSARQFETPDRWRYFMMGNALVVGLVEKMGKRLTELEKSASEAVQAVQAERASVRAIHIQKGKSRSNR